MNTDELKQLIKDKTIIDFDTSDQDFAHGLRLVLRDIETGEMGLLAIEPRAMVLPDEVVLDYSYQVLQSAFGTPPEECLIADLQTRIGPDYDPSDVPFLRGEQSGLF